MKDQYEANEVDEEMGDVNEIERRNLGSLLLIDFQMVDLFNSNSDQNNLYLLKKAKKIIDQVHELKKNFKDITVVRLKKAYWLDCVMLKPNIDEWQVKQQAFYNYDYTPDLLLQSLIDFFDLNDISTINTVYADISAMQAVSLNGTDNKTIYDSLNHIVNNSLISDSEAKKILTHFSSALKLNLQENSHKLDDN